MKTCFLLFIITFHLSGQNKFSEWNKPFVQIKDVSISSSQDTVSDLISLLNNLAINNDNQLFKQHCSSIINVIESKGTLSASELSFIKDLYIAFSDSNISYNNSHLSSYTQRKRPFIISWTSPTDSVVSLGWLLLPENWDPEKVYPLYISLHGLYAPYENPIEYMVRYLSPGLFIEKSFENGYTFFPWGRGNKWYEGISETDIWEGINIVEGSVKINAAKKYLMGHSMGGYGTWYIAQKSSQVWAALGIYAGALGYSGGMLNAAIAEKLKDVPIYIVCGDQDGLLSANQTAYQLLMDAGNTNVYFTTFHGGHESLLENWQNMYSWMKNWTNTNDASDKKTIPTEFKLFDNYPNPFNPSTTIRYSLPQDGNVKLEVFNLIGKKISTLADKVQNAGMHEIEFDGSSLSSGVYFYKITVESSSSRPVFVATKKMILVR
jgi:predicted esterase